MYAHRHHACAYACVNVKCCAADVDRRLRFTSSIYHPPLFPLKGEPTDAALLADEAAARAFYQDLWADDDSFLKSTAEVGGCDAKDACA